MHELTNTRHNELIDPTLSIWDWQIPVYLFLGGMVAGMMIIAGYFMFSGRNKNIDCSCFIVPVISFFLISFGMLALFLDLEHKLYVWRLYLTFKITSPMSWGSWILLLVYPALFLNILLHVPETIKKRIPKISLISEKISSSNFWIKSIGIANMLIGGLLGIYTGVLLSTLGARPLWNTSILWMLFLVSGLSSAAAFVHLIAKNKDERELLAKADNGFLILELFVFALFIIGLLTSSEVYIKAAHIILSGPFAAVFWVFVILLGIIIPLIIQLLAVNHKVKHTPVAPVMVILGGLILRFLIVYAGQYSHWVR
jgi:protein NrfD